PLLRCWPVLLVIFNRNLGDQGDTAWPYLHGLFRRAYVSDNAPSAALSFLTTRLSLWLRPALDRRNKQNKPAMIPRDARKRRPKRLGESFMRAWRTPIPSDGPGRYTH